MPKKKITQEDIEAIIGSQFTQQQLDKFVENIYQLKNDGLSFMEALSHYSSTHDIDPEDLGKLVAINPELLADVTVEASQNRLLKIRKIRRLEV